MVAYGIILSPWTVLFGLIATATNRTKKRTRIVRKWPHITFYSASGPKDTILYVRIFIIHQLHRYDVKPTESLRNLTFDAQYHAFVKTTVIITDGARSSNLWVHRTRPLRYTYTEIVTNNFNIFCHFSEAA
jgi:hypothetical protein